MDMGKQVRSLQTMKFFVYILITNKERGQILHQKKYIF